jgi:hypothetical protein
MAKKLLAMLLATLMLLGVFAVGATATDAEPPVFTEEEVAMFFANGGSLMDLVYDFAPQGWLWSPGESFARSIENRLIRYDRILMTASSEAQVAALMAMFQWLMTTREPITQLGLNVAGNNLANAFSGVLRQHREMNIFQALWSWFIGQFWWIWLPIVVGVAGVGVWYFTQA